MISSREAVLKDLSDSDSESDEITRTVINRKKRQNQRRSHGYRMKSVGTSSTDSETGWTSDRKSSASTVSTTIHSLSTSIEPKVSVSPSLNSSSGTEAALIIATALLVVQKYSDIVISHGLSVSCLVGCGILWRNSIPIHTLIFPAIVSLVNSPPSLDINLIIPLAFAPVPYEVRKLTGIFLFPQNPAIIDFTLQFSKALTEISYPSLNVTEIQLVSALLVNLLFAAKSLPALALQGLLLGSFVAFYPAFPLIQWSISLSGVVAPGKRPKNAESMKLKLAVGAFTIYILNMLFIIGPWFVQSVTGEPFNPLDVFKVFTLILDAALPLIQEGATLQPSLDNLAPHGFMAAYWLAILLPGVGLVHRYCRQWPVDFRRKIWHAFVVIMFLFIGPSVDREFTRLCFAVAAIPLFILLELIRATALPPFGSWLHWALLPYTDSRDTTGPLILSHISLLLGVSLPILLPGPLQATPSGIISVGMGDACASIIGRRYGRHKWPNSLKSLEGSLAFTLAVTLGLEACKWFLPGYNLSGMHTWTILLVATATSALETVTSINDNFVVPIYLQILLDLANTR